jgi:hypothetical protein
MMVPNASHSVPPIRNAGLIAKLLAATEEPRLELDWFLDVRRTNTSFERGLLHAPGPIEGTCFQASVHAGDLEVLFRAFADAMSCRAVSVPLRLVRADKSVVATVCEITLARGEAGVDQRFELRVRLATVQSGK